MQKFDDAGGMTKKEIVGDESCTFVKKKKKKVIKADHGSGAKMSRCHLVG